MSGAATDNLRQAVPFFCVSNIETSRRFYVDSLGFRIKHQWVVDGKLRWCWVERGGAAMMLQEFATHGHDSWTPKGPTGEGVTIYFICDDALAFYREVKARGVDASEPQVGNSMWVTMVNDPDGYKLGFESMTDVPEETRLSEL